MDGMLAAFWLGSGAVIVTNIVMRLWLPEPSSQRSYALLPPMLSTDAGVAGPHPEPSGDFAGELVADALAAGGD